MEQHSVTCKYNDISILELIALEIGHEIFNIWFHSVLKVSSVAPNESYRTVLKKIINFQSFAATFTKKC